VVGDMVASVGTILIQPGDGDMRVYLEQLARLESIPARLALPAHGEPIDAPSALFRKYITHRQMREAKVYDALGRAGEEGKGLQDLVADVYGDTPVHLWPIALLSLRSHLDKLLYEGRATQRGELWQAGKG